MARKSIPALTITMYMPVAVTIAKNLIYKEVIQLCNQSIESDVVLCFRMQMRLGGFSGKGYTNSPMQPKNQSVPIIWFMLFPNTIDDITLTHDNLGA